MFSHQPSRAFPCTATLSAVFAKRANQTALWLGLSKGVGSFTVRDRVGWEVVSCNLVKVQHQATYSRVCSGEARRRRVASMRTLDEKSSISYLVGISDGVNKPRGSRRQSLEDHGGYVCSGGRRRSCLLPRIRSQWLLTTSPEV